jgi:hypothetical protein
VEACYLFGLFNDTLTNAHIIVIEREDGMSFRLNQSGNTEHKT